MLYLHNMCVYYAAIKQLFIFVLGYHGTGGLLTVSSPPDASPIATVFPEAGKQLGYPNIDLNGPIQTGFAIPQVCLNC